MMINKRLIAMVEDAKKPIKQNILLQWLSLISNVAFIFSIANLLQELFFDTVSRETFLVTVAISVIAVLIRYLTTVLGAKASFRASENVKLILRDKIYKKLLQLGPSYHQKVSTSEVVQVAVEGVDQLEIYFGKYLPQFFYSLLAPLTLFVILSFISLKSAVVLLLCVPLIPLSIIVVQKFAKKLLAKYWGSYTQLGDSFLENLQGLTTLKIYQADEEKNKEMNKQAEHFRKITMKVLTMQLNSVTLMDLIAYGGAALGMIVCVGEFMKGNINFAGCLSITLLSADFFIPLRLLGSFFHIAMNGMAATEKIFKLLDLETPQRGALTLENTEAAIEGKAVTFSYEEDRPILKGIDFSVPQGAFVSLVGESGSGKSTIASLLSARNTGYKGSITIGGKELADISTESLMNYLTIVDHNAYLFKGTVKENLQMAKENANEQEMWQVLEQVNLAAFLKGEEGLQTLLSEKGENLSGGQRQRLSIARALLHDSDIYIFDEVTSNIDLESETDIMEAIYALREKTVILISHRLANVVSSDKIYVLESGALVNQGTHRELLGQEGLYKNLFTKQQELEQFGKEGQNAQK